MLTRTVMTTELLAALTGMAQAGTLITPSLSTSVGIPFISYCVVTGKGVSKGKSGVTHCIRDASDTPIACVTAP